MTRIRVVCLLGPTGTGKTDAALDLAEAFHGAVINVDSRQVHAGLAVLTAQPTPEERARCPHALYGDTPLDAAMAAGEFARRARAAVADFAGRGYLPLLVGGTGLYFRAVLTGLAPIPPVPPKVREEVARQWEILGPVAMHARLGAVDPDYAARIAPTDRQRVTRALEVQAATGRAFGDWHREPDPEAPDYAVLKLGLTLPMEELASRLARRIETMLVAGALDEVERGRQRFSADAPGLTGIGAPELLGYLDGKIDLDTAKAAWLANTRAYAKRQMTWFRKEAGVRWFAPGEHAAMIATVADWLEEAV